MGTAPPAGQTRLQSSSVSRWQLIPLNPSNSWNEKTPFCLHWLPFEQNRICFRTFISDLTSSTSVASSVDLLSDGEDDASFLSLPSATYSQRPSLTAELSESNTPNQQLLIQVIKDGRRHVTPSTNGPKD